MAFLIGGANSAADTGYNVANSCRFNAGDNPRFARTSDTPDNADKYTLSVWIKRSDVGATDNYHYIMSFDTGGNPREHIRFEDSTDVFTWYHRNASATAKSLTTNALYRDPSAWYHICCIYDSSQGTEANRQKIFINGTQVTSFATEEYVAQDEDSNLNNASNNPKIGCLGNAAGTTGNFDGYMAEFHFVDGVAKAATDFGEFDSDSPTIWKVKEYGGSHGTNGFYLDFADSSALGNDVSGNNNDVASTGLAAVDQTTDTPTNNFCTLNPLVNVPYTTYSEGNVFVDNTATGASSHKSYFGNIAFSAGKWYWEAKALGGDKYTIGLTDARNQSDYQQIATTNDIVGYHAVSYPSGDAIGWYYDTIRKNGSVIEASLHTIATNDIMMIAVDANDGKVYFGYNGTWSKADSTTFDAAENDTTFTTGLLYLPAFSIEDCDWSANWGNPAYANSSSAADENGYGDFEYAPPSGFLAICTKNLGSDGG